MIPLRIIHVLTGAFWFGAVGFVALILFPSVRAIGAAGKPLMYQIGHVRKWPIVIISIATLNIVSGIALYWIDSSGFKNSFSRSGPGMVFGLGGVLGLLALAHGIAMNVTTGRRLGQLAARPESDSTSVETSQEIQRLQAKMARSAIAVVIMVTLALICMASARYISW